MQEVVIEAKTKEEAIKKAEEALNASSKEIIYSITEIKGKLFKGTTYKISATTLTEVQRSAAERAKYNYGTLSKCAYQTYGNYNNGGKRLTQDQFHGGGNNYKDFIKVGFDTTSIWDIKTGGGAYPRFYKIATQLPQAPTAY